MAHHIYHAEAIILGAFPSGEGDRLLYCYTRELGLVLAHAKSIREARSRLRYSLQLFSHARIDLIRGRHGWKLISATPITSFRDIWGHPGRRHVAAQHLRLVRRLIQGEEPHDTLFDELLRGFHLLSSIDEHETLKDAELLLVVRLLNALGYWGEQQMFFPVVDGVLISEENLKQMRPLRTRILTEVNQALLSTQL